jgi:hypothetical protein
MKFSSLQEKMPEVFPCTRCAAGQPSNLVF